MDAIKVLEKLSPMDNRVVSFGCELMTWDAANSQWTDPTVDDKTLITLQWVGDVGHRDGFPVTVADADLIMTPSATPNDFIPPHIIKIVLSGITELKLPTSIVTAITDSNGLPVTNYTVTYVNDGVLLDVSQLNGFFTIFLTDKKITTFDISNIADDILILNGMYNVYGFLQQDGTVTKPYSKIVYENGKTKLTLTDPSVTSGNVLYDYVNWIRVPVAYSENTIKLDIEIPAKAVSILNGEVYNVNYTILEGATEIQVSANTSIIQLMLSSWINRLENFAINVSATKVDPNPLSPEKFGGNIKFGDMTYVMGRENVVGGIAARIVSFDRTNKKIQIKPINDTQILDLSNYEHNTKCYIATYQNDDNSPYVKTIIESTSIDFQTIELTLDDVSDINENFEDYLQEDHSFSCIIVPEEGREWTAEAVGEYNMVTGWNGYANGNQNVLTGNHSYAHGINNDVYSEHSNIAGVMNRAIGRQHFIFGVNNKVTGDGATIFGSNNACFAINAYVQGMGNTLKTDNPDVQHVNYAVVFGDTNTIKANFAKVLGSQCTINAEGATVIGMDLENNAPFALLLGRHAVLPEKKVLENSPESGIHYRDAIAFAAGLDPAYSPDQDKVGMIFSKYRYESNPLYDPNDPNNSEPEFLLFEYYLLQIFANVEIDGVLKIKGAKAKACEPGIVIPEAAPILDFAIASCWKLTLTTNDVTPVLHNWVDGASGRLIVYNGSTHLNIPADWIEVGTIPALQSDGFDVFTIEQVDDTVFIKHEYAKTN